MIEKAFEKNKEGAGIAWREKDTVRWMKGITDVEDLQKMVARLPMPFISHCRIQTMGGVHKELTHPFPVDTDSILALNGRTKGYLMFHNGTWGKWKDQTLEAAFKTGTKLPGGRWSDSRAMAFVASIYGLGALEFIDEKSVVISPTDIQVFGNGWSRINDVACSNRLWEDVKIYGATTRYEPAIVPGAPTVGKAVGGPSHTETFRTEDKGIQREEDKPKSLEAGTSGVRQDRTGTQEEKITPIKSIVQTNLDSIKALPPVSDDNLAAIEYVRSLNPSSFRSPLRPDDTERDRRIEDARKGITHLGKM